MTEEVLRFENVWYEKKSSTDRIEDISLTLNRGEGMLLSGPEGSGKSLIMDLIMARLVPNRGSIYLEQELVDPKDTQAIEKLRFSTGYVTQTSGLINNLSLFENIVLPLRYHTEMKDDDLSAACAIWLDRYELTHKKNIRPVALSASERMRTALIRALIVEPRILLLDSIVDALCPLASRRMLELLFEDIRLRNMTYIMSSYHPAIFRQRNLKLVLLYKGKIMFAGTDAENHRANNAYLDQYLAYNTVGPMHPFNDAV